MPRDFVIHGPTMVSVKGGAHMSGQAIGNVSELGLAVGPITVSPQFNHYDIIPDDFSPSVPCEVGWHLAEVRVQMTLIHYNPTVLDICISESMGGARLEQVFPPPTLPEVQYAGVMQPAGRLLGKGRPIFSSGCNFISLNIETNPDPAAIQNGSAEPAYRFRACYLDSKPLEIPIGTQATAAVLNWRCIPYRPLFQSGYAPGRSTQNAIFIDGIPHTPWEHLSSGVVLWDRTQDT